MLTKGMVMICAHCGFPKNEHYEVPSARISIRPPILICPTNVFSEVRRGVEEITEIKRKG